MCHVHAEMDLQIATVITLINLFVVPNKQKSANSISKVH